MHAPAAARSAADLLAAGLLRSPASGLLDGALLLLTVRGRRTGREYTFPVQYAEDGPALWVLPGRPDTKTWWRNLLEPARVGLHWRGQDLGGSARVLDGGREPWAVEAGLRAYLTRFPRTARRLGVDDGHGGLDPRLLHDVAVRTVLVRIVPFDGRVVGGVAQPVPGPVD